MLQIVVAQRRAVQQIPRCILDCRRLRPVRRIVVRPDHAVQPVVLQARNRAVRRIGVLPAPRRIRSKLLARQPAMLVIAVLHALAVAIVHLLQLLMPVRFVYVLAQELAAHLHRRRLAERVVIEAVAHVHGVARRVVSHLRQAVVGIGVCALVRSRRRRCLSARHAARCVVAIAHALSVRQCRLRDRAVCVVGIAHRIAARIGAALQSVAVCGIRARAADGRLVVRVLPLVCRSVAVCVVGIHILHQHRRVLIAHQVLLARVIVKAIVHPAGVLRPRARRRILRKVVVRVVQANILIARLRAHIAQRAVGIVVVFLAIGLAVERQPVEHRLVDVLLIIDGIADFRIRARRLHHARGILPVRPFLVPVHIAAVRPCR